MHSIYTQKRNLFLSCAAAGIAASMMYAPMASAVVPNDNITPDEAVDTDGGVNGVGQFFRSDGFVCTGTLINPRTVLFAAHCVNNRPESDFGPTIQSAFSFDVNALPGFLDWTGNGFASNPDLYVYNVNQIYWNPDSVARPDGFGFIEGDIALASLDTPAANVPTWALLFSRLPDPTSADPVNGTGYHVNITGYGRSGFGSFGDFQGVDWRRRAAENMLGALTSLDDRNIFLFGQAFGDLPQNLYHIDFDDPNQTNPFDFNIYQDEPLANEGTTAGGDSGGPLILDAANNTLSNEDLVIGVLSGGSRFFGGQRFSSYGTNSFYQPLFLFHEYIAATNPYRYVSALAGDGAWEDASHWQTDLDPNYRIIDSTGTVVNGFPDVQQSGINETTDQGFGTICFDPQGANFGDGCEDLATGNAVPPARQSGPGQDVTNGNATTVNNAVRLSDDELAALGLNAGTGPDGLSEVRIYESVDTLFGESGADFVENIAQAAGDPLPAATIENGLAGATNFVPDNIDPPSGFNGTRRYFDVRLSNSGTTTLSSTVTIDRLSVAGDAGLVIDASGNLTSLMDISQSGGRIAIDGAFNSVGDYTLFSGMLSGSGTVTAPFFTSIAGMIAPGSLGTTDTLTIDGNAVLASGTGLFIDIGANGVNDILAITGDSSLGGNVFFNPTTDVRAGNTYTFLTTGGSQSGEFNGQQISPLLRPVLSYSGNSVTATIEAGSFSTVLSNGNDVQSAYSRLLDNARGKGALDAIFAELDLSSVERIGGILNSWTPAMETTNRSLAKTSTEGISRFHRDRMGDMGANKWGGTITVMGSPIQMASNSDYMSHMSDMNHLMASNDGSTRTTASLPSDYSAYLSGSFVDGDGQSMPTANQPNVQEDFDGWAITGGLERYVSEKVSIGGSLTYSELEASGSLGHIAESDYIAGTLYGQYRSTDSLVYDAQLSLGSFGSKTSRVVAGAGGPVTLTSDDNSMSFMGDLQVSKPISLSSVTLSPHFGLRKMIIDFDDVLETGGAPALLIQRNRYESAQGRAGLDLKTKAESKFQLRLSGDIVREFDSPSDSFNAQFAGVPGAGAAFVLSGTDTTWGEIGAGISIDLGQMRINASADTTIERSDVEAQTYRAGVTYKF